MSISALQTKAARTIINWSQETLAQKAQVSKRTIIDFERNARHPQRSTIAAIKTALEVAGIEFIENEQPSPSGGPGVRLKKEPTS